MKLYRAIVEDNNDPEKIGRVKVRIYGLHTSKNENSEEFSAISTADLPWAEVMQGNQFGLVSGVGVSSVLRQGTMVWIILEDENPNKPVVIGTLIGKNTGPSQGVYDGGDGFVDPDGVYPPADAKPIEPKDDTMTAGATAKRDTTSDIHPKVQEKYLTLATLETESGHLIELDDTPGDERVKVQHKTGSYVLIDKNGDIFVHGVRDMQYDITRNATMNIGGNTTWNITGNLVENVAGSGGIDINATGGNVNIDATSNINLNNG